MVVGWTGSAQGEIVVDCQSRVQTMQWKVYILWVAGVLWLLLGVATWCGQPHKSGAYHQKPRDRRLGSNT